MFGSVARAQENENSDVDVMIIGALGFTEAVRLLYPVQATIGREINPKVFTVKEWRAKMEAGDSFVQDVLNNPPIFLIADDSDFAKFSRDECLTLHSVTPAFNERNFKLKGEDK